MSVGEVGPSNGHLCNSSIEGVEKNKTTASDLGAQILEQGEERKISKTKRRLSVRLSKSSSISFDRFSSKEGKRKEESTAQPSLTKNQTQTAATSKIPSKKKHSSSTTEGDSSSQGSVKKSSSVTFSSDNESFPKAYFSRSSASSESLLNTSETLSSRSSQSLPSPKSSYVNPEDSKELVFIKNIRNFEREKRERADSSRLTDDRLILKALHQENKVTSREACLGYKTVMPTETFILTLHQYYLEINSYANTPEEEKIKKCECLMLFKEWLSFHSFYFEDFKNATTVETIKTFCLCLKEEFSGYYRKLICEIDEIVIEASTKDKSPKKCVKTLDEFLNYFKHDVKAIAEEFFRLSIQLQSKISSEIFHPECSINQLIYGLNNSLTSLVIENLLEEHQNESISVHELSKKQLKKYKLYISLIREMKTGSNAFWCSALLKAVGSIQVKEIFQNENRITKWGPFLEEAGAFVAGISEEGKHQRKAFLYDKGLPISFNNLFSTCASLKDKFPETEEGWTNAGLIATAATIAEDLLERQKCNTHLTTETNLFDLLWWKLNEEKSEEEEHFAWKS